MKKSLLFIAIFFVIQTSFSQEKKGKPFFTGSLNLTFALNENYVLFDSDDGETLLIPAALFLRTGFGYQFNRRFAVSLNAGFDYHWNYAVSAFPTYGSLHYNITEKDGNTFFIETSYGKMWRPSSKYTDGKYYGIGIGVQVIGEKRWNTILRLDFHRKAILGFYNDSLDSVSLGIGFSFF
ncbi:hypothetical protein BTO04_08915 [Polaribacter sp. SA4-10]|uniref:hypothetical protein n=1 Tax=Polaribacter sp. SA4-10 TaxID=754397 RepID=UPI000B3D288C|nr:hypothetical protein [Polaribacter sp. SA4-10]ARV06796.1 hypothetical protein BTO04_08915 [Polaribacter sp. SA4-10]